MSRPRGRGQASTRKPLQSSLSRPFGRLQNGWVFDMAGGIDWFRWHHGSVTDPKFQLVARKAGVRLSDVLAVWAFVLEKASSSEDRGTFGDIDCESVDCLFGLDDGKTSEILQHMESRDLVANGSVSAWEKRQPKREREDDKSTGRVQGFRKRQKEQEEAMQGNETPCNATKHTETPRGEERRVDINTPIPPSGAKTGQSAISLPTWLTTIKAMGEDPIPADDPVFGYADSVGIPRDHLRLAWREFRERYSLPNAKRYRCWRTVFRKAVRGNWFKLWHFAGDECALTTTGVQAKRAAEANAGVMA